MKKLHRGFHQRSTTMSFVKVTYLHFPASMFLFSLSTLAYGSGKIGSRNEKRFTFEQKTRESIKSINK